MAKFTKGSSGNPAGRKAGKGALHKFIEDLKNECLGEGEDVPTIKDVRTGLSLLLNTPFDRLEKIVKDKTTPASFYVFADEMINGKNRDKLILQIMEHAYGNETNDPKLI